MNCTELAPQDHRVLGQLTLAARGFEKLCKPTRLSRAFARLAMDETEWKDAVDMLVTFGFVERSEGNTYVVKRCSCEVERGLPSLALRPSKVRKGRSTGAVRGPGWERFPDPSDPLGSVPRPGTGPRPPYRGGLALEAPNSSKKLEAGRRTDSGGAKEQSVLRKKAVSSAKRSQPKPFGVLDLRSAFVQKFNDAKIVDTLGITAMAPPAGKRSDTAFTAALRALLSTGVTPEQVLAMMDEFMHLVSLQIISIEGKTVWQVFIARRDQLLERNERERKLGSASEELLSAEVKQQQLDWLLHGE